MQSEGLKGITDNLSSSVGSQSAASERAAGHWVHMSAPENHPSLLSCIEEETQCLPNIRTLSAFFPRKKKLSRKRREKMAIEGGNNFPWANRISPSACFGPAASNCFPYHGRCSRRGGERVLPAFPRFHPFRLPLNLSRTHSAAKAANGRVMCLLQEAALLRAPPSRT